MFSRKTVPHFSASLPRAPPHFAIAERPRAAGELEENLVAPEHACDAQGNRSAGLARRSRKQRLLA